MQENFYQMKGGISMNAEKDMVRVGTKTGPAADNSRERRLNKS